MVQPKRFLPSVEQDEGERPKRQNSGDLRPGIRRLSSEDEYTTDETSDEEDEEHARLAPGRKSSKPPRRWQPCEDRRLSESVREHGEANWKAIASKVGSRNHVQCLQRWKKVLRPGLVKGQWSAQEDAVLMKLATSGYKNWGVLSNHMPGRTSKQCRERWCHHLDPSINKGAYSPQEDKIIVETQARLGNKWSQIAASLPGRTENSIKIRCKALQRKSTSGGGGGGGGSGGRPAPSSPRATRRSSATSSSRSRTSSSTSASSCASAADSIADEPASYHGDVGLSDLRPPSPPRPQRCSRTVLGNFDPRSYSPSPKLSPPAGNATLFSTTRAPFSQRRRSGKGKTLQLRAAAPFAPSGGSVAPMNSTSAPVPMPMPVAELADSGFYCPLSKAPSMMDGSARGSLPISTPASRWSSPAALSSAATSIKDEFMHQRPQVMGPLMGYNPAERSSPTGGGMAFGKMVEPTDCYPRSLPTCGVLTQPPPLSQYFEYGLNTMMGAPSTALEQGHACLAQPPNGLARSSSFDGDLVLQAAAVNDHGFSAVKDEGESVFGDFNALGVEDLKAVVGEDDQDGAEAPLRSCCSFLDLPSQGMVVGDMPLSW